jgi:Fe2+ transport system protein B
MAEVPMTGRPADRGDVFPRPDPTVLTDRLVEKAITNLREIIDARINGMDQEIARIERDILARPEAISKEIKHLQELHDERFRGIATQFAERDVRVEQTAKDTKAVEKQNEAFSLSINKSEAATLKQIDSQADLIKSATGALNDKIDDIKERLTRIEGAAVGRITEKTEKDTNNHWVLSVVMGTIGVAGFLFTVIREVIIR